MGTYATSKGDDACPSTHPSHLEHKYNFWISQIRSVRLNLESKNKDNATYHCKLS
jgi:hypothetical protein